MSRQDMSDLGLTAETRGREANSCKGTACMQMSAVCPVCLVGD